MMKIQTLYCDYYTDAYMCPYWISSITNNISDY